jgi:hypothetical protein
LAHSVFISYSHKDKLVADAICANLEANGVRCWIAPRDIGLGEDWPAAIARAIPGSRVMVMIYSADSNNSDQVYRELFLAASKSVIILPFKIEDVELEPRKQYLLAGTHWLDAMNPPTQEQIDELVDRVKSFLEKSITIRPDNDAGIVTTPPNGSSNPIPARRIPAWVWGLLIGILIFGGGATSVYLWRRSSKAVPMPSMVPSLTILEATATPPAPYVTSIQATAQTPVPSQTSVQATATTTAPGSQADLARRFAEPILAAIAQTTPDFQDDFSTANPVWKFGGQKGFSSSIEDGVARLRVNQAGGFMTEISNLVRRDFVLQFDARIVTGDTTSKIMVTFHTWPDTHQFVLELYPALQEWSLGTDWDNLTQSGKSLAVRPVGETMQITTIIHDSRFAAYLDQTPVSLLYDANMYSGVIGDNSRRIFIHCESSYQAVCEFDNLKFWNLAQFPGLP